MSNQPYKVCARCGQPAVIQMVTCGRCGLPFPHAQLSSPLAGEMAPGLSAASQRELGQTHAAARPRRTNTLPLVVLLALLVLFALAASRLVRGVDAMAGPAFTGAAGLPGAIGDPTSGVFQERPSASEMPTVILDNGAGGTLTLILRSPEGNEYQVQSRVNEERRIQVPAGHYTLSISCDVPTVQPNYGDATFKQYKEYEAFFVLDDYAPPIHLGD